MTEKNLAVKSCLGGNSHTTRQESASSVAVERKDGSLRMRTYDSVLLVRGNFLFVYFIFLAALNGTADLMRLI